MGETQTHKKLKQKAATSSGKTEVRLSSGKRVDALSSRRAIIVARSDKGQSLELAAKRLKESGKPQRVLQVPQKDMERAVEAMKKAGITGTVKNLKGSKRRYVGATVVKVNLSKTS